MSGLTEYTRYIARDKFEAEETRGMAFPCNVCKHNHNTDSEEPCRSCDHNANAAPDLDK